MSQGISVSIPLEAANSGSLSHTYCFGKSPLEVLVESWLQSSVEARESALILEMIRGAQNFPRVAVLKLVFL